MKTKYFLTSLFLVVSFFGYSQKTKPKPCFSASLDPTQGKNLLHQCSRATPQKVKGYWLVSQIDIDSLEEHFLKLDSLVATDCCLIGGQIKDLNNYGIQYVGVVIKEKKYIYLNAFPKGEIEFMKKYQPTFDPTKSPIVVCDGGMNFWGVLFDIETKEFSLLSFNGIA